jgi:hypothetical protein
MHRRFVWTMLAVAVALGCESTSPADRGTFQASISGELDLQLQGVAEFGVYLGEGFGLHMSPGDGFHLIGIGHDMFARPEVGTYQVYPPDFSQGFHALFLRDTAQGLWGLTSDTGELTITTSTPQRLEGSFNIIVRGFMGGTVPSELVMEGTFSAVCARTVASC